MGLGTIPQCIAFRPQQLKMATFLTWLDCEKF